MVSEWRSVMTVSERRQAVHVHAKHNTDLGNVPDMVSYPGTVASLNKHNWNIQFNSVYQEIHTPRSLPATRWEIFC